VNLSWNFTGIEFEVLCDRFCGGRLPRPLFYTLDEEMTVDESTLLRQETWAGLREKWDPAWDLMIDVMCAPEMFIALRTWDEKDRRDGKKRAHRHYARSGVQGFIFEQKPGKSYWHTDGYIVTECDPRSLATEVVRSLPPVEAGREPSIPLVTETQPRADRSGGSMFMDDDDYDTDAQRSAKFFEMPAAQAGMLAIAQGRSKYGPRGIIETKMEWRDVVGDGRYVIVRDDAPVALATGTREFAARIQKQIDIVMDRLDTHWESGRPEDRY
jgi:hypothetical protein